MNKRLTILLASAGIAAAAGIGLAANEVTGDSVGLSADPLEAGTDLAPPAGGGGDDFRTRERTSEPKGGADRQDPPAAAPVPQPITPTAEPGDDNGGDRSGSEDNSGSGSDDSSGSGSGSDDDSSGPGSGSDDD